MRLDTHRLEQLKRLVVLDTAPEQAYDDLTQALARSLDVPIVVVNLLDAQRDWFKSCVGLPLTESPAATSFCEVFFGSADDIVVVQDTTLDSRFAQHPLVVGPPFIRFYAAVRLVVGSETVGTFCAYDIKPKQVDPQQLADLQAMAHAAMELLHQRELGRSGAA